MLKVSFLEAYNNVNKYDFICIGETYFDSSVESEDDDLRINSYKWTTLWTPKEVVPVCTTKSH